MRAVTRFYFKFSGQMHAQQTLTFGVERTLKQFIPSVKAVVNVPY
ncbi:MAG: hypothetical protein ACTSR5_03015 [Promethearchaeota archaeon]